MYILICDEEKNFIDEWIGRINKYLINERAVKLKTCTTVQEAKKLIEEVSFDIAFIDTEIHGESGIELAKCLYEENEQCLVVFVSNRCEYVSMAFELQVFQFLFKDVDEETLSIEMSRILHEYKKQKAKCVFYTDGVIKTFSPKEIIYIETRNHRTRMMTTSGSFCGETESLSKLKANLEDFGFHQIHQSYFLNLNYILSIRKGEVELTNGEVIPTSILNRKAIKEEIEKFSLQP